MIFHKFRLIGRKRLKEMMQALLLGRRIKRDRVDRAAEEFADAMFSRGCYPQGKSLIASEKAEGRTVVILTAAHRFYAEALARKFGVDHLIATESVWIENDLTARIDGENCHGPGKLKAFERFIAERGAPSSKPDTRFFSDDYSDRPMLEYCDEAIAVNPTRRLRAFSIKRGWTILDWK